MSKTNLNGSRSLSSTSCNSLGLSDYEIIENGLEDPTAGKVNSSSSRPSSTSKTQKAKRVRFFHNGNKYFTGVVIPVAPERYRSFDSLIADLTAILTKCVTLPNGVRNLYSMDGKKISTIDELEDGKEYVCSGKGELFKKIKYSTTDTLKLKRLSNNKQVTTSPSIPRTVVPDCVRPRIVTIIRNGLKPRKILRLLLNKRNASSLEQVLSSVTDAAQLDSGAVRKVFTLAGLPVTTLPQFFASEDVFFVYGNERYSLEDFELEFEESKAIQQYKKPYNGSCTDSESHRRMPLLRNGNGPKPKMPKKELNRTYESEESILWKLSEDISCILPPSISQKYSVGRVIGNGNFAVVRLCKDVTNNKEYALKIIDKSKCQGKENMIENEVSILRKISHPNIMSLIEETDTKKMLYLVCEFVTGGDLFDAITVAQKFSEDQAVLMISHLVSALVYLHNLNIVHRDVKPENLLVEFCSDECSEMRIKTLKLGDFGLACEVTRPLFTVCGTPTYVAPEILAETGYGLKIDVWAAGVIMYILLCGYPPFVSQDNDQEKLFDSILSGQYDFPDEYWSEVSNLAKELIQNMLQLSPELRFSAEDVLDHPWLQIAST